MKNYMLRVRLTQFERQALGALADAAGLSLSDYVRKRVLETTEVVSTNTVSLTMPLRTAVEIDLFSLLKKVGFEP